MEGIRMKNIQLRFDQTGYAMEDILKLKEQVMDAHTKLHEKSGEGNDFVGWVDYPETFDKEEFTRLKAAAKRIQDQSEVLVVVGIGGSYLGARAALDALSHTFYNDLPKEKRKTPQVYFVGNSISGSYIKHLMELIGDKDISVNVISKSGTTTEPAIAFRILKAHLEKKYGKEGAQNRIYATTDKSRGALRELANREGYETFVIPDDVGGRFSIFTPVGLLPIAVAGIDVDAIVQGTIDGMTEYAETDMTKNPCYQYAALRNVLLQSGKDIEVMVNYEPTLSYISEWWKQLYGESEGKDGKGIFPASVNFSTDLHSMGQYIQDGQRKLFETIINIEKPNEDSEVIWDEANLDNLNYLHGKTVDQVNKKAMQGTILAHVDGGVPNAIIDIPEMTPYYFGKLFYFFMKGCGISGYILDVNPFNQPGVEAYKKNMFALLGKPGFEDLKAELEARL